MKHTTTTNASNFIFAGLHSNKSIITMFMIGIFPQGFSNFLLHALFSRGFYSSFFFFLASHPTIYIYYTTSSSIIIIYKLQTVRNMAGFNNVVFSRNHYLPHYSAPYKIERVTVLLKDKETTATIYPIFYLEGLPDNLLLFLTQEYNDEISRGDTQPFFDPLTVDEFRDYWFGQFTAVMVLGDDPVLDESVSVKQWATKCLGTVFIKSCYPGRSAHVCTCNILVNAGIRRRGIGTTLTECFLTWAPRLGYSYCMIDLIFETNIAAKQMLEHLKFKKIGRVKGCGLLKSTKDSLIDALIYGRDLELGHEDDMNSKTEDIKMYLNSGQYPPNFNRQEKSRLRALAYHYSVKEGKLYLKGKEVISDVAEQLRITKKIHSKAHLGINKTTSKICERYHWPKVKETVTTVIKHCPQCSDPAKSSLVRSQVATVRFRRRKDNINSKSNHSKMITGHSVPVTASSSSVSTIPDADVSASTFPSGLPFVRPTPFVDLYRAPDAQNSAYDHLDTQMADVVDVDALVNGSPQKHGVGIRQNQSDQSLNASAVNNKMLLHSVASEIRHYDDSGIHINTPVQNGVRDIRLHSSQGLGLDNKADRANESNDPENSSSDNNQDRDLQHDVNSASKQSVDALSFIPYYLSDPQI